jgi:hypothetical protein
MSTGMTYSTSVVSRWKRAAAISTAYDVLYDLLGGVFSGWASGHHWRRHRSHQSQRDGAATRLASYPMELKLTRGMEPQLSPLSTFTRLVNILPSKCWRKKRCPHGWLASGDPPPNGGAIATRPPPPPPPPPSSYEGDDEAVAASLGRDQSMEAGHQFVREIEPQLSSLSTSTRLMNILEARHRWKSTNSLTTRSPRGMLLVRILPPNTGTLHPSRQHTMSSIRSVWTRSG